MPHEVRPTKEELQEAKKIVKQALIESEEKLRIETKVKVALGWSRKDFVLEEMGGASGYAKYPNIVGLDFNTNAENWRESLRASAFHEYAHVWDYEQRGRRWEKRWQYIIGEALTQHFAEQNAEYESPWRTEHSEEKVAGFWTELRDREIDKNMEEVAPNAKDPVFINQGVGKYPNWLGYSLAYQIGKKLLEEHSLEDFPELEKTDLTKAGNQLYEK
jgi:uncharacterized protein YjaZ